jgi:hypothetical protein
MNTVVILRTLRDHGATVRAEGGNLRLNAPTPLPPAMVEAVRAEKPALVRLLTNHPDFLDRLDEYEERAAIKEYDANIPRAEADRQAWLEIFGTLLQENVAA